MRSAFKKTDKLVGKDFWAWLPLQPTREASAPQPATRQAAADDAWEGPTLEDLRMSTTQELDGGPTLEGWARVG
jgi:hypothetical protein